MTHYNVLVLGAGPGGYVAAIRAAQLGKQLLPWVLAMFVLSCAVFLLVGILGFIPGITTWSWPSTSSST